MPDDDGWDAYARDKIRKERLGVTVVLPTVIPPGGSGPGGQPSGPITPPPAGPKSDGHTYDIMKTLNKSGVDWFVINTVNNLNDANADYNSRVGAGGGYWQILRDGTNIIKTNLPIEDRFKPGAQVQGDGHMYTIQVMTVNGWMNVGGNAGDPVGAKADMESMANGIYPGGTWGAGNYRIINENGAVVATLDNRPIRPSVEPSIPPPVSKTGCFIATAAYGTDMDPRIDALRQFRDDKLLTNATGRAMVKTYYTISPPIARGIARSGPMRAMVRRLLKPIVDHLNN